MTQDERNLEDKATEILRHDAKDHDTTLYREGIIDERRRNLINKREIPMSKFEKKREKDD
jgi:hypothetical protein